MTTPRPESYAELNTDEPTNTFAVTYDNRTYSISQALCRKIGFLEGMLYAGLFDDLALPLPVRPNLVDVGHNLLQYMANHPNSGLNYLEMGILNGLSVKEYMARLVGESSENQKIELEQIRDVMAQIFALLALSDYWDFKIITHECTNFLALHLAKATPDYYQRMARRGDLITNSC